MSSDFDESLSDYSRQVVKSIEPMEDVQLESVNTSEDGSREESKIISSPQGEKVVEGEPVFDDRSEESDDSRTDSDSPEEAAGTGHGLTPAQIDAVDDDESNTGHESDSRMEVTGSFTGQERKVDDATKEIVAFEDENELFGRQPPPSYQVPPRVDSEFSSHDTDSTESTDSTGSQLEEDSQLEDVLRRQEKSRKRKKSTHGPEAQVTDGSLELRPTKKTKRSLNRAYLDMLNQDIAHAASQGCPTDQDRTDKRMTLPSSQIGVNFWTSMEKEHFFEALGRLGRDDTAGIAERIHTKDEMEVRQYLKLLQDAFTHRRQQNELGPLRLEDFPAAVEISHECCQALEEVADNIAMRQKRSEDTAEEHEHGPSLLISKNDCKSLEAEAEDDISNPADIFRTKEWLSLSERFFMNAPTAEGNWQSLDGNTPSFRLTLLNDFYVLALTLTRRIMAASLYMATSRIRAESGYRRQMREFVKERDVRAAALSLGLATQKPPLTRCVRRLGLSVYEHSPKADKANDLEPMSITDVEDAFDIDGLRKASHIRHKMEHVALSDDSSMSSDSPVESETESDEERDSRSASGEAESGEEGDIKVEADEAILYSAVDPPQTKRDRQALYRGIQAEREQERYADAVDAQRSYQEEVEMWKLLGRQPPEDLTDPGPPPPGRRMNLSVEARYSVGRDWRAKTRVMSEWEAQYLGIH